MASAVDKRVALRGYDPVAYFTDGRAVKGTPDLQASFEDAEYHFQTADHRAMFVAAPDRYAPQYAGYCTGAIALGAVKVEADPGAWTISDGRLFVFFAEEDIADFNQHAENTIHQADEHWRAMRDKVAP